MIAAVETPGSECGQLFHALYRWLPQVQADGRLRPIGPNPLFVWHLMTRGFGLYEAGARHWAVTQPKQLGAAGRSIMRATVIDFLYWINGPIAKAYCTTQTTVPR